MLRRACLTIRSRRSRSGGGVWAPAWSTSQPNCKEQAFLIRSAQITDSFGPIYAEAGCCQNIGGLSFTATKIGSVDTVDDRFSAAASSNSLTSGLSRVDAPSKRTMTVWRIFLHGNRAARRLLFRLSAVLRNQLPPPSSLHGRVPALNRVTMSQFCPYPVRTP